MPGLPNYAETVYIRTRAFTLDASAKIRLGFAVLSGLWGVQTHHFGEALPWLLLVVVLDLVVVALDNANSDRHDVADGVALSLLAFSAAAAGAAYAVTGPAGAVLILIPAFHAGTKNGRSGYLLACAIGTASAVSTARLST